MSNLHEGIGKVYEAARSLSTDVLDIVSQADMAARMGDDEASDIWYHLKEAHSLAMQLRSELTLAMTRKRKTLSEQVGE